MHLLHLQSNDSSGDQLKPKLGRGVASLLRAVLGGEEGLDLGERCCIASRARGSCLDRRRCDS